MHRLYLLLVSLSLATVAGASPSGKPNAPANGSALATALAYDSAFTGYQRDVEPVVADWKQTNAAIAASSAHAGHAGHAGHADHAGHASHATAAAKPDAHAGHDMTATKTSKPQKSAPEDLKAMEPAKHNAHAGHKPGVKPAQPSPRPKAKEKTESIAKPDSHDAHQH